MGAEERVALEWQRTHGGREEEVVFVTGARGYFELRADRGHPYVSISVDADTPAEAQAECERIARAAGLLPPAPPPAEGPRQ